MKGIKVSKYTAIIVDNDDNIKGRLCLMANDTWAPCDENERIISGMRFKGVRDAVKSYKNGEIKF